MSDTQVIRIGKPFTERSTPLTVSGEFRICSHLTPRPRAIMKRNILKKHCLLPLSICVDWTTRRGYRSLSNT